MQWDFKGKRAIVTGAARGFGREIAESLLAAGAHVILVDISGLEETAAGMADAYPGVLRRYCDVSEEDDVTGLMDFANATMGGLDFLVNNAGVITGGPFDACTLESWERTIKVNLTGTFLMTKYGLEIMSAGGRIVNIASVAGQLGGVIVGPDYAASKGGVLAFTKAAAKYAAPRGITVNAVSPSTVPTEGTAFLESGFETMRQNAPLKRLGTTEDVANAVCFLLSEGASFLTGTTIDVNGGMLMR